MCARAAHYFNVNCGQWTWSFKLIYHQLSQVMILMIEKCTQRAMNNKPFELFAFVRHRLSSCFVYEAKTRARFHEISCLSTTLHKASTLSTHPVCCWMCLLTERSSSFVEKSLHERQWMSAIRCCRRQTNSCLICSTLHCVPKCSTFAWWLTTSHRLNNYHSVANLNFLWTREEWAEMIISSRPEMNARRFIVHQCLRSQTQEHTSSNLPFHRDFIRFSAPRNHSLGECSISFGSSLISRASLNQHKISRIIFQCQVMCANTNWVCSCS